MKDGLSEYLSCEALNMHREYFKKQCLRYSVLKKMYPEICRNEICEFARIRTKDRAEIEELYFDILYHKLYFSSYGKQYQFSEAVKKRFKSQASFLYELLQAGKDEKYGFILIYVKGGYADFVISTNSKARRIEPVLSVDLCEHAYFSDYGFDKEKYLKDILASLNLGMLDKFL
ncbi:MAG: hypothetical protein E7612_01235 [Ruminococcaceae bacterium]|nr:hypothetical protein [Oscillospiraceae bacterium]